MADADLSEAFAWAEKRLGRGLLPRERDFIKTGGAAFPDEFDWKTSKRPEAATDENRFDARLICWLLTKDIPGVICGHEGIEIAGLWIENTLALPFVTCGRSLTLAECVFETAPLLQDTHLQHLFLPGSKLPGLNAQRLNCAGDVFLRNGFESQGSVDLAGARISGALECDGGTFSVTEGRALNCNATMIGEGVLLREGFTASGEVNFVGAKITGQLSCDGGSFSALQGRALNCDSAVIGANVFLRNGFTATGEVNFVRTEVTGNLRCRSAKIEGVFDAEGAKIGGGFFWEEISGAVEALDLTETSVSRLTDDTASWACVETAKLSGFRYDSIQSAMTVQDRLALLARKGERTLPSPTTKPSTRKDFDPQPYSQLAKVYESMGHRIDAAKVRFARDERLMWAAFARAMAQSKPDTFGKGTAILSLIWGRIYRDTFGFGHAPFKALRTALLILIATWWLSDQTYQRGEFAPASPVVLTSAEWFVASRLGCKAQQVEGCTMPLQLWEQSTAYRDYETFSPALYALDLFLPLDTLGQEDAWAPSKDRGAFGLTLYWARWAVQLSGWLLLATAAAVFTGVLGKKD
ncbi:hypothetical protein SAMN05877809_10944 [Rhodobacter sp. JA431]|uniref:hypothetical protein n=1 Tax=Rhodobacter sp. JA431 TaxID=570013 RepID=UPI000BCF9A7E|nr:hypothetical protein [Rhodobacter sp. JA431]SOC17103.1 hypothetical protein SAMN05877809_10944 [Rhodobacter sp. JA431]